MKANSCYRVLSNLSSKKTISVNSTIYLPGWLSALFSEVSSLMVFVLSVRGVPWCGGRCIRCKLRSPAVATAAAVQAATVAERKKQRNAAGLIFARCALHTLLSQLLTCQRASCSSACSCSSLWPLHNRKFKTEINYLLWLTVLNYFVSIG